MYGKSGKINSKNELFFNRRKAVFLFINQVIIFKQILDLKK
nr:MAG TPA: hypothetical protein [Caudoviricetes sp.]